MRKATLDDFGVKKEPLRFPIEHMEEFAKKLEEKFGEFSHKGLHRFYSKANIAKVAWGMKVRKEDDTIEVIKLPYGKIVSIYQYPEMRGNKIWKQYELDSDFPFTFWQELYTQTCKHFGKIAFIEQKKLEGLEQLAEGIGEEIHE